MMTKSLVLGLALCSILFLMPVAVANGQSLQGAWTGDIKCEGLEGPSVGMPGAKVKVERNILLLIAQGAATGTGAIAPKSLDVLLFESGNTSPRAAWCGWMNTGNDDMTKGQGSLGPFGRYTPNSLSYLFYVAPPPPFPSTQLAYGDSTMHMKKWELVKPDANGCDAKLEMQGSIWVPGGAVPLGIGAPWGGSSIFATCMVKAKRCPSAVAPIPFCQHWGSPPP